MDKERYRTQTELMVKLIMIIIITSTIVMNYYQLLLTIIIIMIVERRPPHQSRDRLDGPSRTAARDYPMRERSMPRPAERTSRPQSQAESNPDFYFMPSQRRYSGEVVRVFVDNPDYKL